MLLLLAQPSRAASIGASSLDFAHAYKHVGSAADQLDYATLVLSGSSGAQIMEGLRTQPFGGARSPVNWERVTSVAEFPDGTAEALQSPALAAMAQIAFVGPPYIRRRRRRRRLHWMGAPSLPITRRSQSRSLYEGERSTPRPF